jgi:hypothetical protein
MKYPVFLIAFVFLAQAFSQSGTVEKVKGSKAILSFPGKTPKIGDVLSVPNDVEAGAFTVGLRPRTHGLTYGANISSLSEEVTQGNTTATSSASTTSLEVLYLRNFGQFEVGGGMVKVNVDNDNDTTALTGVGQYNFVINKPRNDLIPFARGDFRILSGKTGSFSLSGTGLTLGGGVYWFPFGEIFALDAGLNFLIDNYETNTSPSKAKVKSTTTAITAGWRLYF